ncbi:phage tail protein [Burkholderia glumae]|uniref:phage tail protein n=1 Tax=Burkholderia glumae TaxID=337 RepID=UPI0020375CA0|nr:phage tail protein [Burkholderia glumae]
MFAILGDIEFDLIGYFDGFDATFGTDYAEHALLEGKPRLQRIADKLDEIRIELSFHYRFCDPEAELGKLRAALSAKRAMALVFGNGDYKGWFVLTEVQASSKQTDTSGTVLALEASITLREFVGDKKNPLKRPAVQPKLPPAAAQTVSGVTSALKATRREIQQAVTWTNQAQSAMRVAVDAIRVVQKLKGDPLSALSRSSSVLTNIKQAAAPLAKLSPALASLTDQIPDAADILRASNTALDAVRSAQGPLANATAGTITGAIDHAAGQLATASNTLSLAAPSLSKLAAQVATRRI